MVTVHVQYRLCMNIQYPTTGSPQAVQTLAVSTELVRVRVKPGKDSHDHGRAREEAICLHTPFHSQMVCVCKREPPAFALTEVQYAYHLCTVQQMCTMAASC